MIPLGRDKETVNMGLLYHIELLLIFSLTLFLTLEVLLALEHLILSNLRGYKTRGSGAVGE